MTETQRTPEGMSSKPRIKPADAEDGRPVSILRVSDDCNSTIPASSACCRLPTFRMGRKSPKTPSPLIEASLDATRPDLVIFSGNQIAGYDPAFADSFRKRRWC